MKIDRVLLKGVGPKGGGVVVREFSAQFRDGGNAVIGINGCGKTHLLRVIAGVCGNDEATKLLIDLQVEECVIRVINDNGRRITFKTKGGFDLDKVATFKALLSHRVNFPMTEWNKTFPSEVIDPYTARARFECLVGKSAVKEMFQARPGHVHNTAGDGFTRMLRIVFGDGAALVPTLLEYPDHHLDIMNKRRLMTDLCDGDRQVIYTTHSPEMIPHDYRDSHGSDGVIDMSPTQ